MPPISLADSLDELERVAAKLEFRIYTMADWQICASSYSPREEAELAAEVDQHCQTIALSIARPASVPLPEMEPASAYLCLRRLQDAQRHLRERTHRVADPNVSKQSWYERLLVQEWHSYAESYWYERLARYEERLTLQRANRPGQVRQLA